MQVVELSRAGYGANISSQWACKLRQTVFKDRLEWSVSITGNLKMDSYDTLDASYLVVVYGDLGGVDKGDSQITC